MRTKVDEFLTEEIHLVLQNFALTREICLTLAVYYQNELPPPDVTVEFRGAGPCPIVHGKSGGLFVDPVLFKAIVEIRKLTSFFGFRIGKTNKLIAIEDRGGRTQQNPNDDLTIVHVIGRKLSLSEFLQACGGSEVTTDELEASLVHTITFANKALAHLTSISSSAGPEFRHIFQATTGIIRAFQVLVYPALNRPFPDFKFNKR